MRLGALTPEDSCYDPNRPWWGYTDAECACMINEGRPIGEQCASFSGVLQTMSGQVGTVFGAGSSVVGEGIGSGLGAGLSNFAESVNLSGLMLIAATGLAIYILKR